AAGRAGDEQSLVGARHDDEEPRWRAVSVDPDPGPVHAPRRARATPSTPGELPTAIRRGARSKRGTAIAIPRLDRLAQNRLATIQTPRQPYEQCPERERA